MVIFGERMRRLQQLAIIFAVVGVGLLTWSAGEFPWLAIALAVSFSFYGMIRKQVPVDGLVGLAVETFVLLPLALMYLAFSYEQGSEWGEPELLFKLSLSGVVTAIPLLCFGQAARRLPFSMLGFMQYISPSLQFVLAVILFDEPVRGGWLNYALVWTALLVFTLDSFQWYRQQHRIAVT
jgi:chloramphenicol-sensitive protein RarD